VKYKNGLTGGIIAGFIITVFFSLVSGFYVLKVNGLSSVVAEKQQTSNQIGWHNVETWVFGVTTFGVVSVVRAIDYFAYISDENDIKKTMAKFVKWVLDKIRKPREKTISKQKIRRTAILKLKIATVEISRLVISLIASLATLIGIRIKSVVKFILNTTKGRILFVITIEMQDAF
jgi:hypothetical protein